MVASQSNRGTCTSKLGPSGQRYLGVSKERQILLYRNKRACPEHLFYINGHKHMLHLTIAIEIQICPGYEAIIRS